MFGKSFERRRQRNEYYKAKENSYGLLRATYEIRDNDIYFISSHIDGILMIILKSMHRIFVDSFYTLLFESMDHINKAEQADEIGESLISSRAVEMKVSAHAFGVAVALTMCRIAKEANATVDEVGLKSYMEENIHDEHVDDIIETMIYTLDYYYDPFSEFGNVLGSWEAGAITNSMLNKPVEKGHFADPLLGSGTGLAMVTAFSSEQVAGLAALAVDKCIEIGLITRDSKTINSQKNVRSKRHLENLAVTKNKKSGSKPANKRKKSSSSKIAKVELPPERPNSRKITRDQYEEKVRKKVLEKVYEPNAYVDNSGCLTCSGCGKAVPSAEYNFCPSCGKELIEENDDL